MAEDKKSSFPMMPAKSWWALREKFKKTIPSLVTENYLATSLDIEMNSARDNVLRPLRQVGLINEEGKPQEIAKSWRDDQDYAQACQMIRQSIYPQELLDAFPGPNENQDAVERWFRNHSGVGDSAAKKQAAFYLLLTKADVSKAGEPVRNGVNTTTLKSTPRPAPSRSAHKGENIKKQGVGEQALPPPPVTHVSTFPSLHVDVQIHIAPDTPPEQIDRIFESMAKHFKGMNGDTTK